VQHGVLPVRQNGDKPDASASSALGAGRERFS
jgi:hypothetical protein